MLNDTVGFKQIILVTGYTDLRGGINKLSALIEQHFKLSPFEEHVLFLFCGRKTDRIKGLFWAFGINIGHMYTAKIISMQMS